MEILPGASAVVTASGDPLPADAAVLASDGALEAFRRAWSRPAYLEYLFENDRRDALRHLSTDGTAPNSDARPIAYQVAAATWLAKFFPGLLGRPP